MSRIKQFPQAIHVTAYQDQENDYLQVHEDGIYAALGDSKESTVAIYTLASVNKVKRSPPVIKKTKSRKTR